MNSKRNLEKGYNVALHSIRASTGSKDIANQIMQEGLNMPYNASIRATTIQLGDQYRNENFEQDLKEKLQNYIFGGNSEGYTIIIKTPTVIKNSKGEALYLGDPYLGDKNQDMGDNAIKYDQISFLDYVCGRLGKIPSEFIYGYINLEKGVIESNPNYYAKNLENPEKVDSLYNKIKAEMNKLELEISEAVIKGDSKTLAFYKEMVRLYKIDELLAVIEKAEKQCGLEADSHEEID